MHNVALISWEASNYVRKLPVDTYLQIKIALIAENVKPHDLIGYREMVSDPR